METKAIQIVTEKILEELAITKAKDIKLKKIVNHLKVNLKGSELKEDVSGLFIFKNGVGNILYNKKEGKPRQRFTIAHELGHHVLHKLPLSMTKNELKLYRNSDSSTGEIKKEREANSFAASLLMPEKFIRDEIENASDNIKDSVKYLAEKFRVSEQAMTFRLANLGYNLRGTY